MIHMTHASASASEGSGNLDYARKFTIWQLNMGFMYQTVGVVKLFL